MGKTSKAGLGQDLAIDLGASAIRVFLRGSGIVLDEPALVAQDKHSARIVGLGAQAASLLRDTPGNLIALYPLRRGPISDYEMTEALLRECLQRACRGRFFKPRLLLCLPFGSSLLESRSLVDAALQAGARRVYLMEAPLAAARGAGLAVERAEGCMIVDIGGSSTAISILSLGAVALQSTLPMGGQQFDEALVKHIRRTHQLLIGERSAEALKCSIGCVCPPVSEEVCEIKGRCQESGLPGAVSIRASEMAPAFEPITAQILEAIAELLEHSPPELAADIAAQGIVLVGGGALLRGLPARIRAHTGIPARVAEEAQSCLVRGAGLQLEQLSSMQEGSPARVR